MRSRWLLVLGVSAAMAAAAACSSGETTEADDDDGPGGQGGGGGSGGARPDPLPISILNWNVHNLIDDEDDGAMFEDFDPSWEDHVADVARVVRALNPDVAVLQEVEDQEILAALAAEIDAGYAHQSLIDGNDPRGIDIGVLSKIPIDQVVSHQDDQFQANGTGATYRFSRDAPEIHITFNGRQLVLIGTHLKAKQDDDPQKRLAEAQRTRAIADALVAENPARGVIMLGDFNDLPGSPPYVAALGSEPAYVNAAEVVASADRWTYEYQGNQELVDHQMASPLIGEMLDVGSVRILHSPEVDAASDHAPVIATYNVN